MNYYTIVVEQSQEINPTFKFRASFLHYPGWLDSPIGVGDTQIEAMLDLVEQEDSREKK